MQVLNFERYSYKNNIHRNILAFGGAYSKILDLVKELKIFIASIHDVSNSGSTFQNR